MPYFFKITSFPLPKAMKYYSSFISSIFVQITKMFTKDFFMDLKITKTKYNFFKIVILILEKVFDKTKHLGSVKPPKYSNQYNCKICKIYTPLDNKETHFFRETHRLKNNYSEKNCHVCQKYADILNGHCQIATDKLKRNIA